MLRDAPSVRRAFTLIELLVVVSIIALLIAILLPSLQKAREQARCVLCQSNLHAVSIGAYTYATDFGRYPPSHGNLRDLPALMGKAGADWLGVGGHLNQPYSPAPPGNPKAGMPPGFDVAPTLGKIWPYVKNAKVYRCASDKLVPIGSYPTVPSITHPVSENWKFSYTMFASMGFRAPGEGAPSRLSDPVSGGPRGGGAKQYRLPKRPLSGIPMFVEEHPDGIGQFAKGHVEGTFNTGIDRVVGRHGPFRSRLGYRPGQPTISKFKQGVTNIGFADGHVQIVQINHRFTPDDVKEYGGIPDNADGLSYYYGLVYEELWAQPGGGLIPMRSE